ncbi:mRNA decay activator protein ZFP36 [Myripristis murdjan]|uniref:mRNA decay activator protein ZFP36 n=1 Tax=Myripristis murdjan TaxID=586833 RepID=A0A668AQH3_9TELE|nr:mRNA decay activator protein ZFP36-like [Myripristis murdjan]XP_029922543.1 mRNA decay activator protein ZFP36-like [Myripristis murdjan]XP_029922544.1 mRNA decay activator protein ZFP36-like [Myripristis murdjan]
MPSYPLSQFADLEEMMCKQLLSLNLREQNALLPSLSLEMRTPGFVGQPRNHGSFSFSLSSLPYLPTDPSDTALLSSGQWGQQSESPLSPQLPNSAQWGKAGFSVQRSVSMVETGSTTAANLGWPGTEIKHSKSDTCPTPLSTSSFLPSSSSSNSSLFSSTSSASASSSSSRYKTELCRSFAENSICKYGGKCQFAHGAEELRDLNRHPKYKTEPCRTFHTIGFCPYGIRCHFVHNSEEDQKHSFSRSSSSSSSSSSCAPSQPPSSRSRRPPLLRQSFSFAGFPSAPQQALQPNLPPPPPASSFARAPSASPPSCADITDLLSHTFLEMDSAFEASPAHQYQPPVAPTSSADARPQFLPSPDSGCSLCGPSPTASPSLRQSPGATGGFAGPLGTRSLSYTSLSDPDQDGSSGSSASSLSGSETCSGINEGTGRRLAVFSQFSVSEDATSFYL